MNKKMTRWGVGPQFMIISIIYGVLTFACNYWIYPSLTFVLISKTFSVITGGVLIAIGSLVFLIAAFVINKYFVEGKLCSKGIYSIFRHPIYAGWISFIVPGMVFISGLTLAISIPFVMYFVFKILIIDEENYLHSKFGDEYLAYKQKVGAVFPKF